MSEEARRVEEAIIQVNFFRSGLKWFGLKGSANFRGPGGVEHGPRTCRCVEYRGWKDAHPRTLVKVGEPSLAAPVAAVVGVVPGAAFATLLGGFRVAPEHPSAAVAGPGGGVPAFDVGFDGRRLDGAPLRATGRHRLLGGRHVDSDAGGGGSPSPHARW